MPETPTATGRETGSDSGRRVVFVVGSGRSGTSTMAGALQALGVHVPQPEVGADETNSKGFAESQWVVDFHHELLQRSNVQVSDARPSAWFETGKASASGITRARLTEWLGPQFRAAGTLSDAEEPGEQRAITELVVKDPRLAWFLGLWKAAALRCDAQPSYVTMLRHVTEVVGSKQRYYQPGQRGPGTSAFNEVQRTAAWVNMMLHTERATRGATRAFVRYDDLLTDWTVPVFDLGQRIGLRAVQEASANSIRAVHRFIDPDLRRVQTTWADVEVPARLRDLAEQTWVGLLGLVEPGGDTTVAHAVLDDLREQYAAFYGEAEAVAGSSLIAARRQGRQAALESHAAAEAMSSTPTRAPAGGALRAIVPERAKRRLRRALGR